ncbi:tRNA (adenine-N1)-methyltransferase [Candidatus Bathyarchaeota archaeon]|nr:tRNA (adenine-N1)-methyltransferase [Candidatus Bathyarchaeota archaeon]MBS7630146.1 tRNA (adenine-N1)-methyltransferase [Candidatus Bathyarchaeota archaeon]
MDLIKEGDDVLLYLDDRKTFLIRVEEGRQLHTHKGYLQLGELIGKPFGSAVKSSLGVTFYALKPLIRDRLAKTVRRTQVMYPKDIGYLLIRTGIGPGKRVIEAGTGSGALTMALAEQVRPDGRVYSFDVNSEFQSIAAANIDRAGLSPYVELVSKDAAEGFDVQGVDAVILDMATPWVIVSNAYDALIGSGVFASFSPTIEQVMKTVSALKTHRFVEIETIELILRKIIVEPNRTRPETLMIGHSGYLTTARKVS